MRYHYHSVCYMADNGKMRSGVAQLGTRQVPKPVLDSVRVSLDFDENAVLVGHSYLGHMTEDEYQSGVIKIPSILLQICLMLLFSLALVGIFLFTR